MLTSHSFVRFSQLSHNVTRNISRTHQLRFTPFCTILARNAVRHKHTFITVCYVPNKETKKALQKSPLTLLCVFFFGFFFWKIRGMIYISFTNSYRQTANGKIGLMRAIALPLCIAPEMQLSVSNEVIKRRDKTKLGKL